MPGLCSIEQVSCGPVSVVRLENHHAAGPRAADDLAQWTAIVERAKCQKLVIDCSNVEFMCSEMLSRLVMLQRRVRENRGQLVLCGLRREVRDLFAWTKLDRFFEIRAAVDA